MPVTPALGSISYILSSKFEFQASLSYIDPFEKDFKQTLQTKQDTDSTKHLGCRAVFFMDVPGEILSHCLTCILLFLDSEGSTGNLVSNFGRGRQALYHQGASLPFSFLNSYFYFHHFIFGLPTSSFFTYVTF